MTLVRSAQSLEYIRVPVSTTDQHGAAINPSSDPVALAFIDSFTKPTSATSFISAAWEIDDSVPASPVYYVKLLVGPAPNGVYVPTAGTRVAVWVKVTDNPEVPIVQADYIQFV